MNEELSHKAAAAAAEFDTAYKLAFYVVDLILQLITAYVVYIAIQLFFMW